MSPDCRAEPDRLPLEKSTPCPGFIVDLEVRFEEELSDREGALCRGTEELRLEKE